MSLLTLVTENLTSAIDDLAYEVRQARKVVELYDPSQEERDNLERLEARLALLDSKAIELGI